MHMERAHLFSSQFETLPLMIPRPLIGLRQHLDDALEIPPSEQRHRPRNHALDHRPQQPVQHRRLDRVVEDVQPAALGDGLARQPGLASESVEGVVLQGRDGVGVGEDPELGDELSGCQ